MEVHVFPQDAHENICETAKTDGLSSPMLS